MNATNSTSSVAEARRAGFATSWACDAIEKDEPLHDIVNRELPPAVRWLLTQVHGEMK